MGALFVDNTDMYTWREEILDPGELWAQTQIKIEHWSCLLNATGGAPKPEKCWWYPLDYTCEDGEWTYADIVPQDLLITNLDGTKSTTKHQEEVTESKKILGIYNAPAGGNKGHLDYIRSHKGPTQILLQEDAALIIWGDKKTGNISSSLCFHTNKSVACKYHIHQW